MILVLPWLVVGVALFVPVPSLALHAAQAKVPWPHTTHPITCPPVATTKPHFRVSNCRANNHGQVKVVCGKLNTAAAAIGAAFVHTDYAELYCTHATQVGDMNATPSPRCLPLTIFSLDACVSQLLASCEAALNDLHVLCPHTAYEGACTTHTCTCTRSRPCPRNDLALNFLS